MKLSLRSLPYWLAVPAVCASFASAPAPANAHFKLLKPNAWIMEDAQGNPQKQGPCGTDPSSATMTNEVTEVKAGDMVMVQIQETIHHPGWFRVSLAEDRSTFEDIKFTGAGCTYDMSTVPKEPHGNVLADGLEMDENLGGSNRMITQMVKIPDKPCEKCTLQVIQVMADAVHSPPGCIYYHCADVKITGGSATGAAAAGSGGTAAASGSAGTSAAAGGGAGSAATTSAAGATASPASTSGAGGGGGAASTSTTNTNTNTAAAGGTGGSSAAAASKPANSSSSSNGSAGATGTRSSGATASSTGAAGKPASSSSTTATTTAAKSDDSTPAATDAKDGGGCAIARSSAADASAAAWLAALALLLRARRSQRRRDSTPA